MSWDSLAVRHTEAVSTANEESEVRRSRKTGKFTEVCVTDPDATVATNARNRRLEPAYKQHAVVDDLHGVVLDVAVTTGATNEGQMIVEQIDAAEKVTGLSVRTVTADAAYAYAKVFTAFEHCGIEALIPAKAEPLRSPVPLRRFRYDAKHDLLKCLRGKVLRPKRRLNYGRFFYPRARDSGGCDLASICLSKGRANKAVVVGVSIRHCSGRAGVASDGRTRTSSSISATSGARKATMARLRTGMALPARFDAASPICRSRPTSRPQRSTLNGWRPHCWPICSDWCC